MHICGYACEGLRLRSGSFYCSPLNVLQWGLLLIWLAWLASFFLEFPVSASQKAGITGEGGHCACQAFICVVVI